jgi:putative membrane protein
MLRITLAVVHLLALGIGLGAIYGRARALHRLRSDSNALSRAFAADSWWGFAAVLWIGSGVWRGLAGTEKSTAYYMTNHVFFAKMGLLALVLVLELWPMVTLIRWRIANGRNHLPPSSALASTGRALARISDLQTLLIVGIVVAAVMMARGFGAA